jgi:tRNA(Ile)-lysidine synthase TilS/MesJ
MNFDLSYSDWKNEYESILKGLINKKNLLFYSGGKDSSLMLDFIARASKEFGFVVQAHLGAFPIHRYTNEEKDRILTYWNKRDIEIIWHKFIETDEQIKNEVNPCHGCQKIRKDLLKTLVSKEADSLKDLVLIISFSLWDIVGYSLEHILGDIFPHSGDDKDAIKSKRFLETAQRFYPLIRMKEGYTIFRPLIKFNGSDIMKTVNKIKIPMLSVPCEFKDYRPKRVLETYYEKMGLRFDYDSVFNFAKTALDLPDISSYTSIDKEKYLIEFF